MTRIALVALAWLVFCGLLASAQAAQKPTEQAALRIVVINGEDAVNVVQQKTAVAPVIEVRDRNDQPVAGVVVRFAIRSGRATFGGARTLTVATDVAGRAAAAGLTPTASGTLQITATAAFQGQTAAITIAQTNVMTLAQAGAVSGATGSGGGGAASGASAGAGAGSGGGLSATTIGIVGGAAAGGTLVAAKALGGGTVYSGQFSGNFVLAPIPGVFCGFTFAISAGTLKLEIDKIDANSVTGTAKESESGTVTYEPACQLSPKSFTDAFDVPTLAGSSSSLTFDFREQNTFGQNGLRTHILRFSGSMNGNEITGVLSITEVNAPASGPGPTVSGTGDFPVTLR
jgi:hypothetical protein